MSYQTFLHRRSQANDQHGFEPVHLPDWMYDFQRSLVEWAVMQGRSAIFADCGLGKTPMQLAWAENVRRHTGKPVLIVTPLAVSFQTVEEAGKFGYDAGISRDGTIQSGITVTNYERLEHFAPEDFGGVVCDESSAIKSFNGKRRKVVTAFLRLHRYRLMCTATAAPNDYIELGTSSEALGYLGHMDMLSRFFVNDQNMSNMKRVHNRFYADSANQWRFKGHAEEAFWKWVSSWARAMRKPSDFGFENAGFDLPPLVERQHVIQAERDPEERLFAIEVKGISEEREELRDTISERCEKAAEIITEGGSSPAVAWCHLNAESTQLTKLIDGAVEIAGSHHPDDKEEKLLAFSRGEIPVLVTKPSISGWGMNWQHANRMTFFPSHSYEQFYQSVRRMWRFGQKNPVYVDMITTEGGAAALKNLQRKSAKADRMFDALIRHMQDALKIDRRDDTHPNEMEIPSWLAS